MGNYTIIGGDGKQYGPITEAELRKWIAEGRLNQSSMAKAESDAEFRPLSAFPEFASAFGAPPPMSSVAPMLPGDHREAEHKIKIPAIGLMVASIISLLEAIYGLFALKGAAARMQEIEQQLQSNPQAQQFMESMSKFASGPFGMANIIVQIIIAILIFIGAMKMNKLQSYELSFAAAILAVLPCINPCCGWILGLVFGIWAMIVLARSDVRSQFS